ncbi:MAG: hypothetical protein K2W95_22400 [Candidatus Obscuribacterales bacterium]|nr:hypothetical protein [Candidatus Obscuribacterales bacterium]
MKPTRYLTLAMLLMAAANGPALAHGDSLTLAIQKYNAGRLNEALQLLNSAQYDVSRAAEAHYYKGCVLARLGSHADAVREFKLAKLLDHTGTYAPLAKQALQAYGETTQTDRAQAATIQASAPPAPKRLATPGQIETTAGRINTQAKDRIGRVWNEARLKSQDLPPWMTIPPTRGPIVPGFDQNRYRLYDPNRIRNSSWKSNREYDFHQQRAKGVAESAEGLVTLLTREDDGKGVFLVPHGTNLYVRNYEFGTSIDPPLLPKRTEMKMWSLKEKVPAAALAAGNAAQLNQPATTTPAESVQVPLPEPPPTPGLPAVKSQQTTEEEAKVQSEPPNPSPDQRNSEAISKYGTP